MAEVYRGSFRPRVRRRVMLECKDGSRTKQADAAECDINKIVERARRNGGVLPGARQGAYADVSDMADYHGSMLTVLKAQEAFSQLPASVRRRFANDPGEFVNFASDARNVEELVKLGLAKGVPTSTPSTQEPKKVPKSSAKKTETPPPKEGE